MNIAFHLAIFATVALVALGKKDPASSCALFLPDVGCVRVKGSSGWVEFCDIRAADNDDGADGNDKNCVSFRPFGFEENDASGRSVYAVNNLRAAALAPTIGTFPQHCSNTAPVCGNNSDHKGLNYTKIPIRATVGAGTLALDAYIFSANGYIVFGGENKTVSRGGYKFDVAITGYAFDRNGKSITFDIVQKSKGKNSEQVTLSGGKIDGVVENFPRFASRNSTSGAYVWKDMDVSLNSRRGKRVVTFTFAGPFTEAYYDPIVPPVTATVSAASGASFFFTAMAAVMLLVL